MLRWGRIEYVEGVYETVDVFNKTISHNGRGAFGWVT